MSNNRGNDEDTHDDEVDSGDFEESSNISKNSMIIHNMTIVADTGVDIDLNESIKKFGNSFYDPVEFNCIRLDVRIKRVLDSSSRLPDSKEYEHIADVKVVEATKGTKIPVIMQSFHFDSEECKVHRYLDFEPFDYTSVKISVFANGKLAVTGARSLLSATVALEKVCRAIRKRVNKKARVRNINCSNILVVYAYPHRIVLPLFHKSCRDSAYDPLRFSGVRVRIPINKPHVYYDLFGVLSMTKFSSKYDHLIKEQEPESESEHEDTESEEDIVTPVQVPSPSFSKTVYKYKSKIGIQRFVDSTINDKRKVHHSSSQVVVKRKKTRLPKNVSIWTNTNLLDNDSIDFSDPFAKREVEFKNSKEEVVSANIYGSGNITFTGARSISSIQYALSYIYPILEKAQRKA